MNYLIYYSYWKKNIYHFDFLPLPANKSTPPQLSGDKKLSWSILIVTSFLESDLYSSWTLGIIDSTSEMSDCRIRMRMLASTSCDNDFKEISTLQLQYSSEGEKELWSTESTNLIKPLKDEQFQDFRILSLVLGNFAQSLSCFVEDVPHVILADLEDLQASLIQHVGRLAGKKGFKC